MRATGELSGGDQLLRHDGGAAASDSRARTAERQRQQRTFAADSRLQAAGCRRRRSAQQARLGEHDGGANCSPGTSASASKEPQRRSRTRSATNLCCAQAGRAAAMAPAAAPTSPCNRRWLLLEVTQCLRRPSASARPSRPRGRRPRSSVCATVGGRRLAPFASTASHGASGSSAAHWGTERACVSADERLCASRALVCAQDCARAAQRTQPADSAQRAAV